jgi:hypothetical protein
MFRKPKHYIVGSGVGFSVEKITLNTLVYREGDKQTTCIIVHYGRGPIIGEVALGMYSDCWDPPFDKVKISDDDWKRIGDNIRDAYRSKGLEVDVKVMSPEEREDGKRAIETVNLPSPPPEALRPEEREAVERVLERHRRAVEKRKRRKQEQPPGD